MCKLEKHQKWRGYSHWKSTPLWTAKQSQHHQTQIHSCPFPKPQGKTSGAQCRWAKKEIRLENNIQIYCDEDLTTKVFQEREQYRDVSKQLKGRGIKVCSFCCKIIEAEGKVKGSF